MEGLPERGVSPSGWLQTELAIGYQVHIPLHCSQKRQRRSARLPPGSDGFRSPALEPGRDPFPSGHILPGRRINRSVPRRPAVPKRQQRAIGRLPERSRHPSHEETGGPSTQTIPRSPVGHPPSRPEPSRRHGDPARGRRLEAGPSPLSQSQRLARRFNHHSHLATTHTPQLQSPGRHPCQAHTLLVLTLHVVGKAHFYQHVGSNVPGG